MMFTTLTLLSCPVSTQSEVNVFDYVSYIKNRKIWKENSVKNYSFSYYVHNSGGIVIDAEVSVKDGVSSAVVKKIYNKNYENYPYDVDAKISDLKYSGFYYTNVEDIFSGIEKMYENNRQSVKKNSDIYSFTLSVQYSDKGIPMVIDTIWNAKQGVMGLTGPYVKITSFSVVE